MIRLLASGWMTTTGGLSTSISQRAACCALALCLILVGCGGGGGGGGVIEDTSGSSGEVDPPDDPDPPGPPDPPEYTIELLVDVSEAVPSGATGTDREAQVVTVGLPLSLEDDIYLDQNTGRPALAVIAVDPATSGSDAYPIGYQFRQVETWPSTGAVKWLLADILMVDLDAGETAQVMIVNGTGVPPLLAGAVIARDEGDTIRLITGNENGTNAHLNLTISKTDFNLFETVVVNEVPVVQNPSEPGVTGTLKNGSALSMANTTVVIEENGPARAVVLAEGSLHDINDQRVIDFTLRMTARAASRDVEVTFTLRNADLNFPAHVQLGSVELGTHLALSALAPGVAPTATMPLHGAGKPSISRVFNQGTDEMSLYMAQTSAQISTYAGNYIPHIPKQAGSNSELVDQGYRLVAKGVEQSSLGDKSESPEVGFVSLSNGTGGVTVHQRQMPYFWPAGLKARGDGQVTAGVFTEQNDAGYTFLWQQYESRTVVFSFHTGDVPDEYDLATTHEFPLAARASDYAHYRDAGVFAYRLVTEVEAEEALTKMGINYDVNPVNPKQIVMRYLSANTSGGPNNYPGIETRLAGEWLRHGKGGSLLNALDMAVWKSEWQIRRSDGWLDDNAFGSTATQVIPATNDGTVPHTMKNWGDAEHRYREGIILAYYLTGDPRYRDAILDEAEVLKTVNIWEHERWMFRTLVAIANVYQFTVDDPLAFPPGSNGGGDLIGGDGALLQEMIDRLEYFTVNTPGGPIAQIDVCNETSGAGWATQPLEIGAFIEDLPGGQVDGDRGYYVLSSQNKNEKPAGENFQTRGFITSEYGPSAFYHSARVLDPTNADHAAMLFNARARLRDLAWFTYQEIYPYQPNAISRTMTYSYSVCLQDNSQTANDNFHPIMMGMAETYLDYESAELNLDKFLVRGAEMLEAAGLQDGATITHWEILNQRLDVQHFLSIFLESGLDLTSGL
ncbi:MAG: hypothetical protein ACI9EF_002087 [Pseudohongiellaceae bacterium]|jgi:hypothetical protein